MYVKGPAFILRNHIVIQMIIRMVFQVIKLEETIKILENIFLM